MRAKKKLIISMLVVAFVLLSVIATVAIAFALTQQTIKTTLNIGYTVEDIDGTASATFTIGGVTENLTAMKGTQVIGDKLVFKAGDTENAGNLMFPEDALALTAQNDNVVIQYTYSNTGSKHYIASMDFDANIEADNMKVEYSIDGTTYSEDRYAVVVPANTSNRSYWIKISIADKAKSASFTGDFNWLLNGCDPQDKAYLSLPKVEFQGSAGIYSANIASNSEYVGNLVFPSEVNGDPVTTIVQNTSLTQEQKNQVTSVYIPDSVETIRNNSFENFSNLETVTFEQNENAGSASAQSGTGLTHIGASAFYGCSNLKEFVFPNTLIEIRGSAFYGCTSLQSMVIPSTVTTIENDAFFHCVNLNVLEVEEGNTKYLSSGNCLIEKTNKKLMHGCNSSIIPSDGSVEILGEGSFFGCSFKYLNIPYGIKEIQGGAFNGCSKLTTVEIPNSVTTVAGGVFGECSSLNTIIIPNSITEFSEYTFNGCPNLKNVTLNTMNSVVLTAVKNLANENGEMNLTIDTVTEIPSSAFGNCTGLTSVTFGDSVITTGDCAFMRCTGLKTVVIGNNVTTITGYSFVECSELTTVIMGNKVTTIEEGAFNGCYKLKNIEIPSTVTTIGDRAFLYCSSLTSVVIPDGVTSLGEAVFSSCSSLSSLTLGAGLTSIGSMTFEGCGSLTTIVIPDKVTSIGNDAFIGCTGLTSIEVTSGNTTYHSAGKCLIETASKTLVLGCNTSVIPTDGSVTSIGNNAFMGCEGLTSIEIPDSVTSIGNNAFMGCEGLTSIEIPDSVTSIGNSAFSGCTGLTSILIPDSVTSIGVDAFYGCTGLTSVTIGSGVTSIGIAAFQRCTGLTSIVIPDSVTSIGRLAFYGCTGLTSVTIGRGVTNIGDRAFDGCSGLTSVTFENTSGWFIGSSSSATSGTDLSSTDLSNTSTAATYLTSTYSAYNKYWIRK